MIWIWIILIVFLIITFFSFKNFIDDRSSMDGREMQQSREKGLQQIEAVKRETYKETEYKKERRPYISVYSASRKVLIEKYGKPIKTISLKASDYCI